MKTKQIIEQLNTPDPMNQNDALRYINKTMKPNVLTKLSTPAFLDKNAIWNRALTDFWESICVRGAMFDYSKKDAIQRFLYVVCKRRMLKEIEQYTRYRTEDLETTAWTINTTDANMESILIRMEVLDNIYALLGKYINETEREVLTHRFFNMMSYKEMAKAIPIAIGKTPECLKTTKHRAINKIKKALHQDVELQVYLRFLLGKTGGTA